MLKLFNKKLDRMQFGVRFGFAFGFMIAVPSIAPLAILWFSAISMARLADAGKPRWIGAWHIVAMVVASIITYTTNQNPLATGSTTLSLFVSFFMLFHFVLIALPSARPGGPEVNFWRALFMGAAKRSELSSKTSALQQKIAEAQPVRQAWTAEVEKLTQMTQEMSAFQKSMSIPHTLDEKAEFDRLIAAIKVQKAVCDDHQQRYRPVADAMNASTVSLNQHLQSLGVMSQKAS